MSHGSEQVLTEEGLTINSDLATRKITIGHNDHQEGDRKDRLMATITNPEKEKIDLGYLEEVSDRLRSLRWKNIATMSSNIIFSLMTVAGGSFLLIESFENNLVKGIVGAITFGVGTYCFIKSKDNGLIREKVISGTRRFFSEKIKNSSILDCLSNSRPAVE